MNITIHGFKGTADELKELLNKGIYVEEIKENKKSFRVSFSAKSHIHAGKTSRFKDDFEEMYNAHRAGESNTSIGNRFGCSPIYVKKLVKRMSRERNFNSQ